MVGKFLAMMVCNNKNDNKNTGVSQQLSVLTHWCQQILHYCKYGLRDAFQSMSMHRAP